MKHIYMAKVTLTLGAISRRNGCWKWVTKKLRGSFTLCAMSWGVIMNRRQKCLLHPFYHAAQRHRPKSYRAGHWYRQGNSHSQQQLLYNSDIAPSVNSAAIFDAPTPCCGINYRCRATPSVSVALEQDCNISSALAMDILQSCTKPPTVRYHHWENPEKHEVFFQVSLCLIFKSPRIFLLQLGNTGSAMEILSYTFTQKKSMNMFSIYLQSEVTRLFH